MAIRAVAGACVGAGLYAAGRLPHGWLRTCLYWTLFFLLAEGEIPDFVDRSLDRFLLVWAASSLLLGLVVGTAFYVLQRRSRPRPAP